MSTAEQVAVDWLKLAATTTAKVSAVVRYHGHLLHSRVKRNANQPRSAVRPASSPQGPRLLRATGKAPQPGRPRSGQPPPRVKRASESVTRMEAIRRAPRVEWPTRSNQELTMPCTPSRSCGASRRVAITAAHSARSLSRSASGESK